MWRTRHSRRKRTIKRLHRGKIPPSHLLQKRRRRRLLYGAFVCSLVVGALGALSWLSFHPNTSVRAISIIGNEVLKTKMLEAHLWRLTERPYALLFSRNNLLLYPKNALEKNLLQAFPNIRAVKIRTKLTTGMVEVLITERVPFGVWCQETLDCYKVDAEGFLFEKVIPSRDQRLFFGGVEGVLETPLREFVNKKYFKKMNTILTDLSAMELTATTITFENSDATLRIQEGNWNLRIALDKDTGAQIFNLSAILEENNLKAVLTELAYIDMRFGERVYYTMKDGTVAQ